MQPLDYKRVNNDIVISMDIEIVEEYIDNVLQKITTNLKRFIGEDFTDTRKGIDYFGVVLIQSPDLVIIESVLKNAILEVEEVEELTSFTSDFDRSARTLSVTFSAQLKNGDSITDETIEVL